MALVSATSITSSMATFLLGLGLLMMPCLITHAGAQSIGVCNGRIADNLPPEDEVVKFYQANGIKRMRIYEPNEKTIAALNGSNIELMLDVANPNLQSLSDPSAAQSWVKKYILPYSDVKFRYIIVGNEVKVNDANAHFVLPAMHNIYEALSSANLTSKIKVSTATEGSLMGNSFPPSAGSFSESATSYINPILDFLLKTDAPYVANVYPYFSYISDTAKINLDYVLFKATENVVTDGGIGYRNMFDASLDGIYSALEKAGVSKMDVVVSETGWPSDGGAGASVDNARAYYKGVIDHVTKTSGSPKRPGKPIETYLFAMFDENQKNGANSEQHFGLFSPNKEPKYQLSFKTN